MVSEKYSSRPSAVSPVFTLWQQRVQWVLSGNDTHTVNDTLQFGSGCHKQDGRSEFCWQFMIFRTYFPVEHFFFVSPSQFNLSEGWQLLSSRAEVQSAAKTEPSRAFERYRRAASNFTPKSRIPPRTSLPDEVITVILLKMRVFWDESCQGKELQMFRRKILPSSSGSDTQNVGNYLPKKQGWHPRRCVSSHKKNPYLKEPQNSMHPINNWSPLSLSIQSTLPNLYKISLRKSNLNVILPFMTTPPIYCVFLYACPIKLSMQYTSIYSAKPSIIFH